MDYKARIMTNLYSWENFLEMDILDLYYYMKLLYVRPFISHGGITLSRQKLIGPPQEKQIIMQKFHIVLIDLNKSIVDAVSLWLIK